MKTKNTVRTFGSAPSGCSTACSDLDVMLIFSGSDEEVGLALLRRVASALREETGIQGIDKGVENVGGKHTLEFSFEGVDCDVTYGYEHDPKSWLPAQRAAMLRKALERLSASDRAVVEVFTMVLKYIGVVQARGIGREGKLKHIHAVIFALDALATDTEGGPR